MTTRIVRIPGRSAPARRRRLERVTDWMAKRGWRLVDFAEGEASALFERPEDAAPLSRWDGTRWLPGPGALRPGQWLLTLRADPRLLVLPAIPCALALFLAAALFAPSSFDAERIRQEAAAENWYTVNADQLNVREKPDTASQVVGVLYRDQRVLVEGEVNDRWVKVGVPERGYVAREYLTAAKAAPPR